MHLLGELLLSHAFFDSHPLHGPVLQAMRLETLLMVLFDLLTDDSEPLRIFGSLLKSAEDFTINVPTEVYG